MAIDFREATNSQSIWTKFRRRREVAQAFCRTRRFATLPGGVRIALQKPTTHESLKN
jgi:hypothetical protein